MKAVFTLLLLTACTLPDVQDLNLSGCDETCNAQSKVCFNAANLTGTQCLTASLGQLDAGVIQGATSIEQCLEAQNVQEEACVNTLVSCIDTCIAQAEADLRK